MFSVNITGNFKKDLKILKKRSSNDFEVVRNFVKIFLKPVSMV